MERNVNTRLKSAQTRARKLIEQYEKLGWEVKPSVKERAYSEIPKNINKKKAEAMIDNLSAETIRTLRSFKIKVNYSETTPIDTGKRYKSGAKMYSLSKLEEPVEKTKEVTVTPRNIVDITLNQIKFVMKNNPSQSIAHDIESRLYGIDLFGGGIFTTNDREYRRAALLETMKSKDEIEKAVKRSEADEYEASQMLAGLYQELVGEYGYNDKSLAAKQYRYFHNFLSAAGADFGDTSEEMATYEDVVIWLIDHEREWNFYRKKFRLKHTQHQQYDSNGLLNDVSTAVVEHPEYKKEILRFLIQCIKRSVEPWRIPDAIERYVKSLAKADGSAKTREEEERAIEEAFNNA